MTDHGFTEAVIADEQACFRRKERGVRAMQTGVVLSEYCLIRWSEERTMGRNGHKSRHSLINLAACKTKCFQESKLHLVPAMLRSGKVEDGRNSLNQIFIDHELPTCTVG